MEAGPEDQEARLAPQVQVAHHIDRVLVLASRRLFMAAPLATTDGGQGKLHLGPVPVTRALVTQQLNAHWQIQLHVDPDRPWPPCHAVYSATVGGNAVYAQPP